MRDIAKRFLAQEDGNVAIIFSLALLPILTLAGASTDYSQAAATKVSLQTALDAATLAAARQGIVEEAELRTYLEDYVRPHLADEHLADWDIVAVSQSEGRYRAEATAQVETNFLRLINYDSLMIDVETEVVREFSRLELALVLDNTGSMAGDKMTALRAAATSLVDQMYNTWEADERVTIALVPFVTAVNVLSAGAFSWDWIDVAGCAQHHGANFDTVEFYLPGAPVNNTACTAAASSALLAETRSTQAPDFRGPGRRATRRTFTLPQVQQLDAALNDGNDADNAQDAQTVRSIVGGARNHLDMFDRIGVNWKGCVEARAGAAALNDTAPVAGTPNSLFVPYFWPDEPGDQAAANEAPSVQGNYANDFMRDSLRSGRPAVTNQPTVAAANAERQRNTLKYYPVDYPSAWTGTHGINESPTAIRGPNSACPQPIVALTNDEQKLKDEIAAMQPWSGSGTNIAEGAAWGWRVLSPGQPYTQGAAYNDGETIKAMVVLTDGANNINNRHSTSNPNHNITEYSADGYVAANRLGSTNHGTAMTAMNTRTATVCANIKAQGILLYTITFGAQSTTTTNLMTNCASTPSAQYYSHAPAPDALGDVFAAIAEDLSSLRVAQ